jgi:hypothetical protein
MVVPSSEMEGRRRRAKGEREKEKDERQWRKGLLAKKIEMMGKVFRISGI